MEPQKNCRWREWPQSLFPPLAQDATALVKKRIRLFKTSRTLTKKSQTQILRTFPTEKSWSRGVGLMHHRLQVEPFGDFRYQPSGTTQPSWSSG